MCNAVAHLFSLLTTMPQLLCVANAMLSPRDILYIRVGEIRVFSVYLHNFGYANSKQNLPSSLRYKRIHKKSGVLFIVSFLCIQNLDCSNWIDLYRIFRQKKLPHKMTNLQCRQKSFD